MLRFPVITFFCAIFIFTSCSHKETANINQKPVSAQEAEEIRTSLILVETTNPEEEAIRNFNNGNWLFKGYYTDRLIVPGDENNIAGKGSVDIIKGTQDTILNKEHARLMELVPAYCKRYNLKLRQLLKPTWKNSK